MPASDGNEIIRIPKRELLMLNFVLIHGSWHTGAHWTPVVGHLHQAAIRLSHLRSSAMGKV